MCVAPTIFAPETRAPAPQLWGGAVVQGNCSMWPGHCTEVCMSNPLLNKPSPLKENPLCIIYCCWRMYYELVWIFIPFMLQLNIADFMIKMAKVSAFTCCVGSKPWNWNDLIQLPWHPRVGLHQMFVFCYVFGTIIWNRFIFHCVGLASFWSVASCSPDLVC